jgi:hypothetical protein
LKHVINLVRMHPALYQLGHKSYYGREELAAPWCEGAEPLTALLVT